MSNVPEPQFPVPLTEDAAAEIKALARRAGSAHGTLMNVVGFVGSKAENVLEALPDAVKNAIEAATASALEIAYRGASVAGASRAAPDLGRHGHVLASVATGAAGGFAGLTSAIVELPVTVTIIFGAIQKAARAEGFDTNDDDIRRECLMVFASGDPTDPDDDGTNTSFFASRMLIGGATIHGLIASIAPRLAVTLTQKLAAQTFPVLGSVAGAGINFAFTRYFRELAEIRFALRRLSVAHGQDAVREAFLAAMPRRKGVGRR